MLIIILSKLDAAVDTSVVFTLVSSLRFLEGDLIFRRVIINDLVLTEADVPGASLRNFADGTPRKPKDLALVELC